MSTEGGGKNSSAGGMCGFLHIRREWDFNLNTHGDVYNLESVEKGTQTANWEHGCLKAELEDLEPRLKDVGPIMSLQTTSTPPEVITKPPTTVDSGRDDIPMATGADAE